MKSYLSRLCVKLCLPFSSDDNTVVGYYINIGVDADTEDEAAALAEKSIVDGIVDWGASEVFEADRKTVSKDILEKRPPQQVKGLWYRSGRVLFPAD